MKLSTFVRPKDTQKGEKTKKSLFRKKIIKSYYTIKNNAYICIVVDDETTTDAAGSANQNETEMETLTFTKREINRNFIIKVSGLYNDEKINKAVGVSGFLTLVDDIALANRLLERAFDCPNDKCICKLRRGIKFTFYCH